MTREINIQDMLEESVKDSDSLIPIFDTDTQFIISIDSSTAKRLRRWELVSYLKPCFFN